MSVPMPRLEGVARDLFFFRSPSQWPTWPYLSVVRHKPGDEMDVGVIYDFAHTSSRTGYGCTVFLCNFFCLPATEDELVALPREVFDTFEEMSVAGWTVD
jgi:hypothetical protein